MTVYTLFGVSKLVLRGWQHACRRYILPAVHWVTVPAG